VLAHELKAPLAAIEGYLHIIKDRSAGNDPAVYQHMVERSLVRAEHMRKLIVDLLDMTRRESGTKNRDIIELDLREAAQHAIETNQPMAAERNIRINLDMSGQLTMRADRGEIESILTNLISNAVKYNRDGGRVDIVIAGEGGKITISVSDTGIGMTNEETEKLFQDFVRIKNDKTRDILGSGLGLAIVKKLVQMYNGEISVHSQPDVGSTFKIHLEATQPS